MTEEIKRILMLLDKIKDADCIDDETAIEKGFLSLQDYNKISELNKNIVCFIETHMFSEKEYNSSTYKYEERIKDIKKDLVSSYVRRTQLKQCVNKDQRRIYEIK